MGDNVKLEHDLMSKAGEFYETRRDFLTYSHVVAERVSIIVWEIPSSVQWPECSFQSCYQKSLIYNAISWLHGKPLNSNFIQD
jgi:hypothetical protein